MNPLDFQEDFLFKMDFVTYILYSKTKDSYYIGYTSDIKARLLRHNQKSKGFTN